MDIDQLERALVGTWRHAHEEDSSTQTVYRSASVKLPPARGRTGFELRADHTGVWIGIAARDGASESSCTWQLKAGAPPLLVLTPVRGAPRTFAVIAIEQDRLVVEPA
ncbi:MAG TPA: hypothetical protein VMF89_21740 [Polyangiales bacterium]|nr:hypothetical protein [Polyangiales bacterium]